MISRVFILDAARAIGSESYRAYVLGSLATDFPDVLPKALDAARAIGDEYDRATALWALAPHFPDVLPEALDAARAIGNEFYRARALGDLAPHCPDVLPEALDAARAIGDESYRALALGDLTKKLTPSFINDSLWRQTLHTLATLTRKNFLMLLPELAPSIIHLGGDEALRKTAKALNDASGWWK